MKRLKRSFRFPRSDGSGDPCLLLEGKHVKDVYEEVASAYARRKPWVQLLDLLGKIEGPALDCGCGAGRLVEALCRGVNYTVGMDLSISMLRVAKRIANRKGIACLVDTVAGHVVYLPFRSQCFKTVVAIAVIHHVPDRARRIAAIRSLCDSLVHEGLLLITSWSLLTPKNLLYAVISTLTRGVALKDAFVPWRRGRKKLLRYYHFYTLRELVQDVTRAGLTVLRAFYWGRGGTRARENAVVVATKQQRKD